MLQLSEDVITRFWDPDGIVFSKKQLAVLPELRNSLGKSENHLARLLTGKFVKDTLESSLATELAAELLERSQSTTTAVQMILVLIKLIDRGNANDGLDICPPPYPVQKRNEPNPFRHDRIGDLGFAEQHRELLGRFELKSADFPHWEIHLAAVMVSSVVYGGLLNTAVLLALLKKMQQSIPTTWFGQIAFVDFELDWRNQKNAVFKRWLPDNMSIALMLSFLARSDVQQFREAELDKNRIWKLIRAYLVQAGFKREKLTSFTSWLESISFGIRLALPQVLVEYAQNRIVSHSLKPGAWRRMHGRQDIQSEPTRLNSVESRLLAEGEEAKAEVEPRWLGKIRTALKIEQRSAARTACEQLLPDTDKDYPSYKLAVEFAIWLLAEKNWAVSTVRKAVMKVGRHVGGTLGDVAPGELNAGDWGDAFQVIMAAESDKAGRDVVRILRTFYLFLLTKNEWEADDDVQDLLGAADGLVGVDANCLAEKEFIAIRNQLNKLPYSKDKTKEKITVEQLLFTLSYRCGMRRSEVLMLELDDFNPHDPAELLIRPNAARRLKSVSSTRRIPLAGLLWEDELRVLRNWYNNRMREEEKVQFSSFLFAIPAENIRIFDKEATIYALHEAMRGYTNQADLRFHHLRHSAANRVIIELFSSRLKDTTYIKKLLPGFTACIDRAQETREKLLGNWGVDRRDLWAVMALLGHSEPKISVEHYIHVLDILLAVVMRDQGIVPDDASVLRALGQHRESIRRSKGLENLLFKIQRKRFGVPDQDIKPRKSRERPPADQLLQQQKSGARPDIEQVHVLLLRHFRDQVKPESLVTQFGLPLRRIQRLIANAQQLFAITGRRGNIRHRFETIGADKSVARMIPVPLRPIHAEDLSLIEKLISKMGTLKYGDWRVVKQVAVHYVAYSGERDR